jgi:hypothetical protein
MQESVASDPETAGYIDRTLGLLAKRQNVWVLASHGDLTDIALAHQVVAEQLYERGRKFIPASRIIVVSKMLPEVDYILPEGGKVDAMDVLRSVYNHNFLTWPRTETANPVVGQLPAEVVKSQNGAMKASLVAVLGKGSVLGALSPTGSTQIRRNEQGVYLLPRTSEATIDMMRYGNTPDSPPELQGKKTYVLPVATWFEGEHPLMRICRGPVAITEREEAHQLISEMAEVMTEAVPDKVFGYAGAVGSTAVK